MKQGLARGFAGFSGFAEQIRKALGLTVQIAPTGPADSNPINATVGADTESGGIHQRLFRATGHTCRQHSIPGHGSKKNLSRAAIDRLPFVSRT